MKRALTVASAGLACIVLVGCGNATTTTSQPTSTSVDTNKTTTPAKTTSKPASWKTAATFKGDSMGNTQPFTVGNDWRIVWTATPGKMGAANFATTVMSSDQPGFSGDVVGNVIGKGGSTSYEHGAGTYYLNIMSDENYTVEVQTNVSSLPPQPKYTWKTIYQTTSSSTGNLQPVNVKAPWRIVWSAKPGNIGAGNFAVSVGSDGSTFANVTGTDSGVDYEYTSGTYSLNVTADEDYTIEIQQGQ